MAKTEEPLNELKKTMGTPSNANLSDSHEDPV